jgi:hypothetical protein
MLVLLTARAGAQSTPPAPDVADPSVHWIDCSAPIAQGSSLFVDKANGFQFSYPAALNNRSSPDDLVDECSKFLHKSELIRVQVRLLSGPDGPDRWPEKQSIDTQTFNQIKWVIYSTAGWMKSCTYSNHEQVCILGGAAPTAGPLSNGVVASIHEMMSTFVFRPSDRLDARIAAIRVGQHFGALTVSRVIPMETASGKLPSYTYGTYGEVDFIGAITLDGDYEDMGTAGARVWEFSGKFDDPSQWPLDFGREVLSQVEFRNSSLMDRQRRKLAKVPLNEDGGWDLRVVIKNISVCFGADPGSSVVRADLVSVSQEPPANEPVVDPPQAP